ncbi:MAG: hypothetical protein EOP19_26260, partial [Hyphomicrobiales bacterium]
MNVLHNGDVTALASQAELCAFILRCPPAEAQRVVVEAERLGVDPIDMCARRLGLGEHLVMERAARWAGVDYDAMMPQTIRGSARQLRLDSLATTRTIHADVDGESRYYLAPGIADVLALRSAVRRGGLRHRIVLTPRVALRRARRQ